MADNVNASRRSKRRSRRRSRNSQKNVQQESRPANQVTNHAHNGQNGREHQAGQTKQQPGLPDVFIYTYTIYRDAE